MQFRLSTLLLSVLVVATSLALAGGWGILCAVYVLLVVAWVRVVWSGEYALLKAAAVLFLTVGLPVLLLPEISVAREPARRSACSNNVKQIALALHNYRDVYGRFPPPFLPDKEGRPAHSWRVLILPFMEHEPLYKQYNFKEPWNGPTNAKLAGQRPFNYVCPSDKIAQAPGSSATNCLAVVGPGTVWAESPRDSAAPPLPSDAAKPPGDVSAPKVKLPDPGSKVLVVEVANSGIHWMEPRDLSLEEALAGINAQSSPAISSQHKPRGANVAFADGSVLFLPSNTPPDLLKALITEGLDNAKVARIEELRASQPKPDDYLGLRLLAWLASIVALLVHGLIVDVRRKCAAGEAAPEPPAVSPGSRSDCESR